MNIIRRVLIKLFPQIMSSADLIEILKSKKVRVGKGTVFYYPSTILVDMERPWMVSIGEYCKITRGVIILNHDYSRSVVRRNNHILLGEAGLTSIGDNVFIGMNAIILMGTKIGNNSIIGAGSVVKGNFPDNCVIAGNPATIICTIDEYKEKRRKKEREEALLYASSFYKEYGKFPDKDEMGPFFHLFLERNIDALKENKISLKWGGDNEYEILDDFLKSKPIYESFESFIQDVKNYITTKEKLPNEYQKN